MLGQHVATAGLASSGQGWEPPRHKRGRSWGGPFKLISRLSHTFQLILLSLLKRASRPSVKTPAGNSVKTHRQDVTRG